jgi:hypothetical protein
MAIEKAEGVDFGLRLELHGACLIIFSKPLKSTPVKDVLFAFWVFLHAARRLQSAAKVGTRTGRLLVR